MDRSDSSAAILEVLQGAVSAVSADSGASAKMASRAHFRLAHYADSLYRNIEEQKQSPEWHTAQAVIAHKREEVGLLPAAVALALHMVKPGNSDNGWRQVPHRHTDLLIVSHVPLQYAQQYCKLLANVPIAGEGPAG